MIFELTYKIYGNLKIDKNLNVKKHPYHISIFEKEGSYYISISKHINEHSSCLPIIEISGLHKTIKLPNSESYEDMIEVINHIESFGALDNKLEYIDRLNPLMKWIPENDEEHFLPFNQIERKIQTSQDLTRLSKDWLSHTVISMNQLGDLYIPFSFFRDGKLLFHSARYQSSFCTFYMMLEYFFTEKKWGIKNDVHTRDKCLKTSLIKCLKSLPKYQKHYQWLTKELKKRNKKYDEAGLLFILNRFRNEFSHAAEKDKNRNPFNEHKYFSLAFITLIVCTNVSIKKRLMPYVNPNDLENFLNR